MADPTVDEVEDILRSFAAERLHSIQVGGFKAFGASRSAPLAPLTLLYGPNSAGKSSVLQALTVLSQSTWQPNDALLSLGGRLDVGNVRSVLFEHDASRPITLGFESDVGQTAWELRAELAPAGDRVLVSRFHAELDGAVLELREDPAAEPDEGGRPTLRLADVDSAEVWRKLLAKEAGKHRTAFRDFIEHPGNAELFRRYAAGHAWFWFKSFAQLETHVGGGFEEQPWPWSAELAGDVAEWIYRESPTDEGLGPHLSRIRELAYLGPLREPPSRLYVPAARAGTVGSASEKLVHALDRLTAPQWQHLNDWLARLEIPYAIDLARTEDEVMGTLLAVRLRPTPRGTPAGRAAPQTPDAAAHVGARERVRVSPVDVGFGIGQVLPIVVEGLLGKARLVCVEQPELHLHPRLQAQLADLLIETAGIRKGLEWPVFPKQWIVETHSEPLVQRVLRRIREGSVSPDDVSVLYVHPGVPIPTPDGAPMFEGSAILPLRIDEEGRFIDPWPDGFFEENLREMLA